MRSSSLFLSVSLLFIVYPRQVTAASFAYITNEDSHTVSVVDTATNSVTATIAVGDFPKSVAVDRAGTRVYVAHARRGVLPSGLSVIDTSTNTVVTTVGSGPDVYLPPFGVAVNPAGTRVYVTSGPLGEKLW